MLLAGVLCGCGKEKACDAAFGALRIEAAITRVTGTMFDAGDEIGLTVQFAAGADAYAENRCLRYDGTVFSAADFVWYNDATQASTLTAYYPYTAAGVPTHFSVSAEQRGAGFAASDLLAATRNEVYPVKAPVPMLFDHLMSKVRLNLTNRSDGAVTDITLGGSVIEAAVDVAAKQATASGTAAAEISPREMETGTLYEAIVVPQTAALRVTVLTDDGKRHVHTLERTVLLSGKIYTVSLTLTNIELTGLLSGEVNDWTPGGTIGEAPSEPNTDPDAGSDESTVSHEGVSYRTRRMADGRLWMAENLRYAPAGTPDPASGIYYPGETLTDDTSVARFGLLYTAAAARGGSFDPAAEGMRGLCPAGWHLPTKAEFETLKSAYDAFPADFLTGTPWIWNAATGKYQPTSDQCLLWSSTAATADKSYYLTQEILDGSLVLSLTSRSAASALPLRCLKDE